MVSDASLEGGLHHCVGKGNHQGRTNFMSPREVCLGEGAKACLEVDMASSNKYKSLPFSCQVSRFIQLKAKLSSLGQHVSTCT